MALIYVYGEQVIDGLGLFLMIVDENYGTTDIKMKCLERREKEIGSC